MSGKAVGTQEHQLMRRIVLGAWRRARTLIKPLTSNYWTEYLCHRLLPASTPLVLNLGCGFHALPGAVNIDVRNTPAVDVLCNVTRLPYRKGSVARIETYHLIEHMPYNAAERAMAHWFALLAPGGVLVIECPDLDAAIGDYLAGNEVRLGNIFGLQRFPTDFHFWGWNGSRLAAILARIGFVNVKVSVGTDYHVATEPCIRVEAQHPGERDS